MLLVARRRAGTRAGRSASRAGSPNRSTGSAAATSRSRPGRIFATTLHGPRGRARRSSGSSSILTDPSEGAIRASRWAERIDWVRIGAESHAAERVGPHAGRRPPSAPRRDWRWRSKSATRSTRSRPSCSRWSTFIATLILIFSLGYMKDETEETVEDHEVDRQSGTASLPPPRPVRPVLPVPVAVLLLDAQPGHRGQPVPGVRELGTGRHLLVPADRLLLRAAERQRARRTRRSSPTASATPASSSAC